MASKLKEAKEVPVEVVEGVITQHCADVRPIDNGFLVTIRVKREHMTGEHVYMTGDMDKNVVVVEHFVTSEDLIGPTIRHITEKYPLGSKISLDKRNQGGYTVYTATRKDN